MPREITRIEVPDPEPMHPTPDGGAETQGAAYRLSAPAVATEPLTVTAPDGTSLTWVPTELCYRDESGRMDYIVGSAPAGVQVRGREARYQRTFPMADDVFLAEAERVKHWVILHEPPRAPAEYLSGRIEFGVTGLVSGVTLPEGRHAEIDAGPFRLPKPVARDLAGREIEGYYEVVPTEGGQQLFVWFPAQDILGTVYPVTIDPTIATNVATNATAAGGRGLVRAADGSYYILIITSSSPYGRVYRSVDGGQTWVDIVFPGFASQPSANQFSIAATDDGAVHVFHFRGSVGVEHWCYDGASWAGPTTVATPPAGETINRGAAVGYGNKLHVAYTIADGRLYYVTHDGQSWRSPTFISSVNAVHPIDIAAYGQTVAIVFEGYIAPQQYLLSCVSTNGGWSFSQYTVDNASSSRGLVVDGDGVIHVVYALAATGDIYCRQWTGGGWSTPAEVVVAAAKPQSLSAIGVGSDLIVVWAGPGGGGEQVHAIVRQAGQWGSIEQLAPSPVRQFNVVAPPSGPATGVPVAWTEGDAVPYSVQSAVVSVNTPPLAPLLDPIENFDATEDAVFTWQFADPDPGDSQTAYQLVIKRASDGVTVYDTGKVASSDRRHIVPGGTLQNSVQYRWTARTWDSLDQVGQYATEQSFLTSAKPSATITDPASDGAVIGTSSYTIQWSMSDPESKGQSAYQVVLKDGGGNVVHDSGKVQGTTARAYTLQNLTNNTTYIVELTVWDGDDVASAVVTRTFTVQYTPPPTPDVTVEALEAWVRLSITNNNAGAEVPAVSNDVYRRKVGEAGSGIRIATGVPVDGVVYDYGVASGVAYEYRVVAIGENGTTAASPWVAAPVLRLTEAWIHDPADPANTIRQFRVSAAQERGEEWAPAMEMLHPAGREHPIAEFGEQTDQRVRFTILVLPDALADLHALRRLADLRTVLCYRDSAGRRIFGVLGAVNIRDERHGGYTVDLEITAVDYDEAV